MAAPASSPSLPVPRTRLIGREVELAAARAALVAALRDESDYANQLRHFAALATVQRQSLVAIDLLRAGRAINRQLQIDDATRNPELTAWFMSRLADQGPIIWGPIFPKWTRFQHLTPWPSHLPLLFARSAKRRPRRFGRAPARRFRCGVATATDYSKVRRGSRARLELVISPAANRKS